MDADRSKSRTTKDTKNTRDSREIGNSSAARTRDQHESQQQESNRGDAERNKTRIESDDVRGATSGQAIDPNAVV